MWQKKIMSLTGRVPQKATEKQQLEDSICIRKEVNRMNRDGGAYNLQPRSTYDRILVTRSSSTSRDHMPD